MKRRHEEMDSSEVGIQNKYEEMNVIGSGAYGTVYKGRNRANNTFVALKRVRISLKDEGIPSNMMREIGLLRHLSNYGHPNVVQILDVCHGRRMEGELNMYIVFEHMEEDLFSYLEKYKDKGGLDLSRKKQISRDILSGVDFLHSQRIVHRDLKPQNLLVTKTGTIKLADFGLAKTYDCDMILTAVKFILSGVDFLHSQRIVHRDLKPQNLLVTKTGTIKLADFGLAKTYDCDMILTAVVVTLWYRAPEVLLGLAYATPVDIWSIGCIIAELYMLKPLFCGSSEVLQLREIFRVLGIPEHGDWPEEKISVQFSSFRDDTKIDIRDVIPDLCDKGFDLIMKMLTFNRAKRITASDALNHPYFQS